MAHPSIGLPPRDRSAGFPAAAARLRDTRERLAIRALEVALDGDPTLRDRHGELGLRQLLKDTEAFIEQLARSVSANDPEWFRHFADMAAPLFRRRLVPMDDLIRLLDAIGVAASTVLGADEQKLADAALDQGIATFRWYRRIAGDARKRNPILAAIYKGA